MRPRNMVAIVLLILVALIAGPVGAKNVVEPVGDLHKLFYGEIQEDGARLASMDANAPFHIYHGHFLPEGDFKLSDYRLEILLDDKKLHRDDLFINETPSKQWLFNFPNGLPNGVYTFEGTWTYPCESAVLQGFFDGECLEKRWTGHGDNPSGASLYQILTVGSG